jgi:hypothetical protein
MEERRDAAEIQEPQKYHRRKVPSDVVCISTPRRHCQILTDATYPAPEADAD